MLRGEKVKRFPWEKAMDDFSPLRYEKSLNLKSII
jgi:hypothetical protein